MKREREYKVLYINSIFTTHEERRRDGCCATQNHLRQCRCQRLRVELFFSLFFFFFIHDKKRGQKGRRIEYFVLG